MTKVPHGPLQQSDFEEIYARVPRLTVEVVIVSVSGVMLALRRDGPCGGLWHLPGGTVRFGEPLTDAVERVAEEELGVEVVTDDLLGYIEYPSHLSLGLDWPVGIAFGVRLTPLSVQQFRPEAGAVQWFTSLPDNMHEEQKYFLRARSLAT
jgi:ADP-ribose pyrophosphatase YjhB (NUDIX family)